jgi:hypothetical protein
MIGVPNSIAQWRAINGLGAAIISLAGAVPLATLRWRSVRRVLPLFCWIAAVGCCMHALVDITLRVLSLTGSHPTQLPSSFWLSFDRRASDLTDLLFNEPWFFVEGVLWAVLGVATLRAPNRRAWIASALATCTILTVIGVLSGIGVIGSFRVGSHFIPRDLCEPALASKLGGETQSHTRCSSRAPTTRGTDRCTSRTLYSSSPRCSL